jgi:hypothetical protein
VSASRRGPHPAARRLSSEVAHSLLGSSPGRGPPQAGVLIRQGGPVTRGTESLTRTPHQGAASWLRIRERFVAIGDRSSPVGSSLLSVASTVHPTRDGLAIRPRGLKPRRGIPQGCPPAPPRASRACSAGRPHFAPRPQRRALADAALPLPPPRCRSAAAASAPPPSAPHRPRWGKPPPSPIPSRHAPLRVPLLAASRRPAPARRALASASPSGGSGQRSDVDGGERSAAGRRCRPSRRCTLGGGASPPPRAPAAR